MKHPRPDRNALVLLGLVVGLAAFVVWDQTRGAGDTARAKPEQPAAAVGPAAEPPPPAAAAPQSRPASDAGESYPTAGVM